MRTTRAIVAEAPAINALGSLSSDQGVVPRCPIVPIAALAAAFELGLPLCDLLLPELALGAILGIGAAKRWKSMVRGDG